MHRQDIPEGNYGHRQDISIDGDPQGAVSNAVMLTVDGRQYRVSDPASRYPEVLVFVSHKNNEWHWRRLPGNGERYWQIIELARARKKEG